MKPTRRPLPMSVPRHVAERALSWYKTLSSNTARSYLRDVNGRRWDIVLHSGLLYVRSRSLWPYGEPSLRYDTQTEQFQLDVFEAHVSYSTGHGRVVYAAGYRAATLDEAYAMYRGRVRYSAK